MTSPLLTEQVGPTHDTIDPVSAATGLTYFDQGNCVRREPDLTSVVSDV